MMQARATVTEEDLYCVNMMQARATVTEEDLYCVKKPTPEQLKEALLQIRDIESRSLGLEKTMTWLASMV